MTTPAESDSYLRFEVLVGKLLVANGYANHAHVAAQLGVDFVVELDRVSARWATEVKFYRTARAQISLIESAAANLHKKVRVAPGLRGMLIVSSNLPPPLSRTLEVKYGITIVDRHILFLWAVRLPEVFDELNAILEEVRSIDDDSDQAEGANAIERKLEIISTVESVEPPPVNTEGTDLVTELRALKSGQNNLAEI
ncbi:restriction endonuclease [Collimonas arenae]|uniref:restriction endonuclease n=1 Tax=Collimonas arenae TaxID=279058 RepID=UPI00155B4036|nr:restriction endonuclease [Collimonas arenae]